MTSTTPTVPPERCTCRRAVRPSKEAIITISTPQPEYITDTHEIVDEALEQRDEPEPPNTEHFKLVPTPGEWMASGWHAKSNQLIMCPVCFSAVPDQFIDEHTQWHEKLLRIVQMLAG